MVPVRIFRVEHLLRFTRAFHLLTIIGEERGNVEFYSSGFDLVVVSRHLFVVLHIKPPFLLYYQPPIFSRFLRIHLWEFRDHLRDTLLTSSSMDFNLDCRRYPPLAALTFHDDTGNYLISSSSFSFLLIIIHLYISWMNEVSACYYFLGSCSVTVSSF